MVGDVVSRLKTEEVIEVIKRGRRIGRLKVGSVISLRYSVSDIKRNEGGCRPLPGAKAEGGVAT